MTSEADELLQRVSDLYMRLWNVDVRATIQDLGGVERFLTEPYTMSGLLADKLRVPDFRTFSEAEAAALAEDLPVLVQAMHAASPRTDSGALLDTPTGQAFLRYLLEAAERLGPDLFAQIADAAVPQDALEGQPVSMSLLADDPERLERLPTEPRLRSLAEAADHAAEKFYLPCLQVALRLRRTKPGETPPTVTRMLGKAVEEARDIWKGTPLEDLLDDDAVVVRHSQAHKWTTYDPATRTITFINHPPKGPEERRGPWTAEDFAHWHTSSFTRRYMTMIVAYGEALAAHAAGLMIPHLRRRLGLDL